MEARKKEGKIVYRIMIIENNMLVEDTNNVEVVSGIYNQIQSYKHFEGGIMVNKEKERYGNTFHGNYSLCERIWFIYRFDYFKQVLQYQISVINEVCDRI